MCRYHAYPLSAITKAYIAAACFFFLIFYYVCAWMFIYMGVCVCRCRWVVWWTITRTTLVLPPPNPTAFLFPLPHPNTQHTTHTQTYLDDRPPHLAAAQPVLAAGGEEGRLRQEHPRNRGEEDHAGQGEEAEEAVHLML